jgi:polyvinyl alcohol dehydrogenase (cytochrome)
MTADRSIGHHRAMQRTANRMILLVVVAALAAVGLPEAQAQVESPACSATITPGGDWPMYGRDLTNSRTQVAESSLSPVRAPTLSPVWRYDTGHPSTVVGLTDINTTPIVSRGCVYLGDAAGDVVALEADTGKVVWRRHIEDDSLPFEAAGAVIGSPFVDGDRVVLVVNRRDAPYATALDASTGETRWTSPPLNTYPGSYSNASPIVFDGTVFVGFSVPEGDPVAQGGFVLVDAKNGTLIKRTYTIPPSEWEQGFAGGGIWSTPAVDGSTGYAYVGVGNPFSKQVEHERTNAILKIDLDRHRPTFGEVVASYKGEIDQVLPLVRDVSRPSCAVMPENPTPHLPLPPFVLDLNQAKDSYACLQLDLDFGAAPNLFPGPDGQLLVGELQKSGVYHVVRADSLAPVARITLGVSCLLCNGASTAYDPRSRAVFAVVTPGTSMASVDPAAGKLRWYSAVGDAVLYQPVAVADGIAYTVDSNGFLDAYDAALGLPLLHRPLVLDGATETGVLTSNGVAIANHTVYIAAGHHLIAYRPSLPRGR